MVGRAAGVRLHVGVVGAEQLLGAVDRQLLDLVHPLAAAVVAAAGVALGVLVGEHRADRLQHGGPGEVLGGDQLQLVALAAQLLVDQARDRRVDLGQAGRLVGLPRLLGYGHGAAPRPVAGGIFDATWRGMGHGVLRHRQHVAVGVAEPGHPDAARRRPHAQLVLLHPVEARELDPAARQLLHGGGDVGHAPAEHGVRRARRPRARLSPAAASRRRRTRSRTASARPAAAQASPRRTRATAPRPLVAHERDQLARAQQPARPVRLDRQPGRRPRLEPAGQVGRALDAQPQQRLGRERRRVPLLAHDDHLAGGGGDPRILVARGRIDPPLQHVSVDPDRARAPARLRRAARGCACRVSTAPRSIARCASAGWSCR